MLTNEQKEKIVKVLNERIETLQCPMCNKGPFTFIDGLFNFSLQGSLSSYTLGGTSVPMITIVCNNCGYVSFHALGALGLMGSFKKSNKSNEESNRDSNSKQPV